MAVLNTFFLVIICKITVFNAFAFSFLKFVLYDTRLCGLRPFMLVLHFWAFNA